MDTYTFIVEMAKALAWPTALMAALVILRRPLAGLIPLLQRIRYKNLEVEFAQKTQRTRDEARAELPPGRHRRGLPTDVQDRILKIAAISPRLAVIEAWRELELHMLETARKLPQFQDVTFRRPFEAIQALEKAEQLPSRFASMIQTLRELRNRAAHAPEFALASESAARYAIATDEVVAALKSLEDDAQEPH